MVGDMWWWMHFQNLSFNAIKLSSCVYCMPQTECPLTKKKSLSCPRSTCLWSQCMKHTTKNWQVKHIDKTKWQQKTTHNYYKDFLSWYEIKSEMYNKTGRIRPRKLISWRFICFCENKAFVLNFFSCSLPIQTPDSLLCMFLLEHCDTQLRLHLFQNINDNNFNNSHTHTQSYFPNQLLHSKSLSQLVLKSKVKEPHVMWKS